LFILNGLSSAACSFQICQCSPIFCGVAPQTHIARLSGSTSSLHQNSFVETALSYALTYASTILHPVTFEPSCITILADNDYYSLQVSDGEHAQWPEHERFHNFNIPLEDAHKTGLGSSAALVTAFIGAVLTHYLPEKAFSLATTSGKLHLHNLAQLAHSAAQGKVGSGFDVASAVYGSCIYRRFSPSLIKALGEFGSANFAKKLKAIVEDSTAPHLWDMEIIKSQVIVPKGLRLVMCDVDCGSKTPGMVKKVLEWRAKHPENAKRLWTALQDLNDEIAAELIRLAESGDRSYTNLESCIRNARQLIREMGTESGVAIEPDAQTKLLDACSTLSGVIGGVVPGAGGYDAVTFLVEDKDGVTEELRLFLGDWVMNPKEGSGERISKVRLLDVREEVGGVQLEPPENYDSWTGG